MQGCGTLIWSPINPRVTTRKFGGYFNDLFGRFVPNLLQAEVAFEKNHRRRGSQTKNTGDKIALEQNIWKHVK